MAEEKEEKLRAAFAKIKQDMDSLKQEINNMKQKISKITSILKGPANTQQFSTQTANIEGIRPYLAISKGNDGVPADSQQTFDTSESQEKEPFEATNKEKLTFRQVKKIVDNLTQDLKLKFKSLSKQEFYIFSLVYSLDVQGQKPDYKTIAIKANLTESSVRDYISRLIHKGIPLRKEKINNKTIVISVPDELKSLATLDNLTKLKQYDEYTVDDTSMI